MKHSMIEQFNKNIIKRSNYNKCLTKEEHFINISNDVGNIDNQNY